MPPDLAQLSILISLNYPCLELIFMVPKVFEPLKFDCSLGFNRSNTSQAGPLASNFITLISLQTYKYDFEISALKVKMTLCLREVIALNNHFSIWF